MDKSQHYQTYVSKMRQIADVEASIAVLNWDKEVNIPPKGVKVRSQQISTLSGLAHNLKTHSDFLQVVKELMEQKEHLSQDQYRNVFKTHQALQRATKLDEEFVQRRSLIISKAYEHWIKARRANDFSIYAPYLEKVVEIKIEEAHKIGCKGHIYNALLDEYERGMTVEKLDVIFDGVRQHLGPLLGKIRACKSTDDSFLHLEYPFQKQWDFSLDLLKNIGYDFEAGRQDLSEHPFSTSFGFGDIRLTTRSDDNNFACMCWSSLHEGGHGLYEQGLLEEHYGLPIGQFISLGIHESQSRLWENQVGRSKNFWTFHYPKLQGIFPENLQNISLEQFYKGINKINPHPIRVESDELHYHFHILIRYEIEKALIDGSLSVKDLEAKWNALYKEYLGLDIESPNDGVLQDIHWAIGSLGYFPTYSLGSFYAAQFYEKAKEEIPTLEDQIREGNSQELLKFLQTQIYQHGQRYEANHLCKRITGRELDYSYFKKYVEDKYGEIYSL